MVERKTGRPIKTERQKDRKTERQKHKQRNINRGTETEIKIEL
jgi:hypothetical protein